MMKRPFLIPVIFILSSLLIQPNLQAEIVYVDQNATGDGTSWENACLTITAGLTASVSGDDIWVKSATYAEAIEMKEGIALYGGFPIDGSPSFEQRDWRANETILNATGLNTHAVVGADLAVLDGFTITGGRADGGGGVYCNHSSPTLVSFCCGKPQFRYGRWCRLGD